MSNEDTAVTENPPPRKSSGKTFLCVVDDTPEFAAALHFACCRAVNTGGRVALLYVTQPAEFQHWAAVGDRMRQEAREEAEEMLAVVSGRVQEKTGQTTAVYIREGTVREQVVDLINDETHISFLVLGAASGTDGPGPLISYLVERMTGELRVPVVIVPGGLSNEDIEAIT